jgi:spore coat protein A
VYELRVETGAVPGAGTPAPMFVIGNALGLLNAPVPVGLLRIAPGERYDVVVDFAGLHRQVLTLTNSAKTPYPDGDPPETGLADQLMQFNVGLKPRDTPAPASLPTNLRPVSGSLAPPDASAAVKTRKILMVEGTDPYGRLMTMLGPIDSSLPAPLQGTLFYKDPVTETPALGSTEIWEFYNTTVDAHPMHIHLVEFRVLNRQRFTIRGSDPDGDPHENLQAKDMGGGFIGGIVDASAIGFTDPDTGAPFPVNPPPAWEAGKKDTVLAFPGEVTRVLVTFRRSGTYVYHCHILSHEDHEMMRPYQVVAPPATAAQTVRAD